jgi:hypothetical protein
MFNAYNINGASYFKLRDIALILGNRFSVDYADGIVTLTTGETYEPTGAESVSRAGAFSAIVPSNDVVKLDGAEITFDAYKIDGSNYYKLRDLGGVLGFRVEFDEAANVVQLTTMAM